MAGNSAPVRSLASLRQPFLPTPSSIDVERRTAVALGWKRFDLPIGPQCHMLIGMNCIWKDDKMTKRRIRICLAMLVASLAWPLSGRLMAQNAPGDRWGIFGPDHRVISLEKRLELDRQFGMTWVRINSQAPPMGAKGMTTVDEIAAYHEKGFKILLTVTNSDLEKGDASPAQFDRYVTALKEEIGEYHPEIVIVENEIDNPPNRLSAESYLKQLKASCQVAHANGASCTDGGMTAKMMIALLVDDDFSKGNTKQAEQDAGYLWLWYRKPDNFRGTTSEIKDFLHQAGVPRARAITEGLKVNNADLIDLHWYVRPSNSITDSEQTDLLRRIIQVMKSHSGLPIVSGEVGTDEPHGVEDAKADPRPFLRMMCSLKELTSGPIVVWNPGSGLFPDNLNARSLVDAKGSPLPLGVAYEQLTHATVNPCGSFTQ